MYQDLETAQPSEKRDSVAIGQTLIYMSYLSLHGHIHKTVALSGEFVGRIGRSICVVVGNDLRPNRPWLIEAKLNVEPVLRLVQIQSCR